MSSTGNHLTAIQTLLVEVSKIERRHYRPATDRRENVAEHSISVAVLAWFLHKHVKSKTNLGTVIQYALIHDFVEVYAGDVNTFASSAARAQKEIREQESLERLTFEFTMFPDMTAAMHRYQAMDSPEARFVWTTDKMQQLILGQLDSWRAYREHQITLAAFDAKMSELHTKAAPELADTFREIIEWSRQTYPSAVATRL